MPKFALFLISSIFYLGNGFMTIASEGLDPKNRKVPKMPSKEQRIRVIIDTDAKNEIDDQWAIALAILSPERFEIGGFYWRQL